VVLKMYSDFGKIIMLDGVFILDCGELTTSEVGVKLKTNYPRVLGFDK